MKFIKILGLIEIKMIHITYRCDYWEEVLNSVKVKI